MIGSRLKFLRGNRRQEDIAQALGISRARYSHYENDIRDPDSATLNLLADFYDVSADYLLGRTDTSEITPQEKDEEEFQAFINDPELGVWYKELPQSNEEELRKLRAIWEMIRNERKN